jgi:hypothetical protein
LDIINSGQDLTIHIIYTSPEINIYKPILDALIEKILKLNEEKIKQILRKIDILTQRIKTSKTLNEKKKRIYILVLGYLKDAINSELEG